MAYDPTKPYTYGIPDGIYTGKPTTASCYEKNGRLILDIKFAVIDPRTGQYMLKQNGYEWEAQKRHWLTAADGGFNEATIKGLREWAKGWNPQTIDDFYWFQQPDANGTPFGNLAAVGEVELNFQTDNTGAQQLWVHDPNRPRGGGRKAFTPDGAVTDLAQIKAKWGSKAKALFASQPKPLASTPAPKAPAAAPAASAAQTDAVAPARPAAAPAAAPARPAASSPWDNYPKTADGAFAYYCSLLGEPYQSAKHDAKWWQINDEAVPGKDPDQLTPADVQRLFAAVKAAM